MDSVWGRIACVDLTSGRVNIETIPDAVLHMFLGGRGLAAQIMARKVPPRIDPLSPQNCLIFATGPVTGSGVQGSDRTYIAAKSPLTGLIFGSTMGGRFASRLKDAGYDALAVTGRANSPKYILMDGGKVSILDATDLAVKSPQEVLATLAANMQGFEVCTTGIAGENMVRYASIVHPRLNGRHGVAGRGGLGAVMASKGLKAVVVHGSPSATRAASNEALKDIRNAISATLKTAPVPKDLFANGTASSVTRINSLGGLGTRNATSETFEGAESISGAQLKTHYWRQDTACHSCAVACGKLGELDGGLVEIPEYESLYALGSMTGVSDLDSLVRANHLCNEYGLDTISTGVTIAFAIECFERGLFSKDQFEGQELRFGDGELLLALIDEIAQRQSVGKLLAEGTRHMAEMLGGDAWKYAYQVKGLEIPGHSPRLMKSMAVGYATGTRGGSHQDARPRYGPQMTDYEGKVEQAIACQDLSAVGDSLVMCRFTMESGCGREFNEVYTNLLKALTGWGPDPTELTVIGERICSLERLFNVREGISRKDDSLPRRVMFEPIPDGAAAGQKTPREKLDELLDRYYPLRGWEQQWPAFSRDSRASGAW